MPFSQTPYDLRTQAIMKTAFDDAWSTYCERAMSSNEDAEVIRAAMADLIASAVANGIRDPLRLKQIALGMRQPG